MVASLFLWLGDDEIVLIFRYLASLPSSLLVGNALRAHVANTVAGCAAVACTCSYLHGLLARVDTRLAQELHARRTLDVQPLPMIGCNLKPSETPYIEHTERMQREMALVKVLRRAETHLCFHCAGKHCETARCEVSRKSGCVVSGVANSRVTNVGACSLSNYAFVAMRTYDSMKQSRDVIRRVDCVGEYAPNDEHRLQPGQQDSDDMFCETILTMAAHPHGACCAFIVENWRLPEAGNEAGNALYMMVPGGEDGLQPACKHRVSPSDAKNYDGVTDLPGVCYAQAVWWKRNTDSQSGAPEWSLCVAWSTTNIEPDGRDDRNGAIVTPEERFVVARYLWHDDRKVVEPEDMCGPYFGRLLTIKATQDGSRVAAHVRRRPMHRWELHYTALVIDVDNAQAAEARHPNIWKCNGKRRMGKDGFDWGPSAVGISPAGDSVVCVHRTSGGVMMEVLDHADGVNYVTTNSRDVSEFVTEASYDIDELDELFESESSGYESSAVNPPNHTGDYPNKVKLPFDVGFTSTGSHACLVDRRPQFGCRAARYHMVFVDISKRRSVKRMKALPLFQERGSAAKALHWSGSTRLWVQGRRGLVSVCM